MRIVPLTIVQQQEVPPIHNSVWIAEILSHVLTTTKEFATRLRRMCKKSRTNEVFPYFLEQQLHPYPTDGQQNRFFLDYAIMMMTRIIQITVMIPLLIPAKSLHCIDNYQTRNLLSPKLLPELVHLVNHHQLAGKRYSDLVVSRSHHQFWGDSNDVDSVWHSCCDGLPFIP